MPQADQTTFTPGPWEVLDDGMEVREVRFHGYFIASTYALPGGPMADENVPQRKANARLIAAAPDLLEALIEMRNACTAAMRVVADLDTMHLVGADADTRQQRFIDELKASGVVNGFGVRADAALAKAEGR